MSPYVRKVPTASGATAVQIAEKTGGKYRIVEHLGSAYTPEDLAALVEVGKAKLRDPGQATLDFRHRRQTASGIRSREVQQIRPPHRHDPHRVRKTRVRRHR